jgi:protein gp37
MKKKISWTTYTHQFWRGSTKVSEGCKFCYMHRILDGNGADQAEFPAHLRLNAKPRVPNLNDEIRPPVR